MKDDLRAVPTLARDLELETMKALLLEHAVAWRLERGRVAYGDRSFSSEPSGLLREIEPELSAPGANYRPRSRDWRGPEPWDGVLVPHDTRPHAAREGSEG